MMLNVDMKQIKPKEYRKYAKLLNKFRKEYGGIGLYTDNDIRNADQDEGTVFGFVTVDNKIAGIVEIVRSFRPGMKKLTTLYIKPEYRGKGIATEIYKIAVGGNASLELEGFRIAKLKPLLKELGFNYKALIKLDSQNPEHTYYEVYPEQVKTKTESTL